MSNDNFGALVGAMDIEDAPDSGRTHPGLQRSASGKAPPRSVPGRFVATRLALVALIAAALFTLMPAAAQAGTVSTLVKVTSRLFPSGAVVPGGFSDRVPATPGSPVHLTAAEYLYQPAVAPATSGTVYEFMFWDANSTLYPTEKATFSVPSATEVKATAWYLPICVVSSACSGGATAVTTWAFSLTKYHVLPGTPISSVTPTSAWTSPSTSVSTATAVDISAASYLGPHSGSTGGTVFSKWFVFGGSSTSVTISGLDLDVQAGVSPYAIAFYNQYPAYHKPICIGYPYCI
jgi:hypothetical protein